MADFGVYVHIPFCKKACSYCNFYYSTIDIDKNSYVQAICKEIELRADTFSMHRLQSIYFGGGTPSLLSAQHIQKIIQTIFKFFSNQKSSIEITLEANPNDITPDIVKIWKSIGLNRISLGIQSFVDTHLQFMGRIHTAKQALESIELVKKEGFRNISIDLIFGFPLLQDDELKNNLSIACKFEIPHISAYSLTIEPKTLLAHQIKHHKTIAISEAQQAKHFIMIEDYLLGHQFQHYETSNYAQPLFESIHNTAYWNSLPYLGIGASGHSFIDNKRMWNIANHHLYCKSILIEKKLPITIETLTPTQQFNEYIFLSLRQRVGISLHYIMSHWGEAYCNHIHQKKSNFASYGWINEDCEHIRLTTTGQLYTDTIVLEFCL